MFLIYCNISQYAFGISLQLYSSHNQFHQSHVFNFSREQANVLWVCIDLVQKSSSHTHILQSPCWQYLTGIYGSNSGRTSQTGMLLLLSKQRFAVLFEVARAA